MQLLLSSIPILGELIFHCELLSKKAAFTTFILNMVVIFKLKITFFKTVFPRIHSHDCEAAPSTASTSKLNNKNRKVLLHNNTFCQGESCYKLFQKSWHSGENPHDINPQISNVFLHISKYYLLDVPQVVEQQLKVTTEWVTDVD